MPGRRSFERVLDGAGRSARPVLDCYGRAICCATARVGIREGVEAVEPVPNGLEGANTAASSDPDGLLGGGPDIVVVGNTIGNHDRRAYRQ